MIGFAVFRRISFGMICAVYIFEECNKVRRLILFGEFVLTAHKASSF